MSNFVDEIMGFDGSDLTVFNQAKSGNYNDPALYKTLPKNSKSSDGNYHSKIRVLLNPKNKNVSILPVTTYFLEGANGKRLVKSSLSINDTNCPIFQCWRRAWYKPGITEERKAQLREYFQRNNSQYVIVQVIEDNNQPELVGKFMYMKIAKNIADKLGDIMHPSPETGRAPKNALDYLTGLVLDMNVQPGPKDNNQPGREQREVSYSLCSFGDYTPIIKTDGTQLFDDDELELIDTYNTSRNDAVSGKTQKKKEEALRKLGEITDGVKKLYEKALVYLDENLVNPDGTPMDLEKDMGYSPWDESTSAFVDEWCSVVDAGGDPRTNISSFTDKAAENTEEASQQSQESTNEEGGDDLPF